MHRHPIIGATAGDRAPAFPLGNHDSVSDYTVAVMPTWRKQRPKGHKRRKVKPRRFLLKCTRCQWEWLTRSTTKGRLPDVCPHCNSPYWDLPRKSKTA